MTKSILPLEETRFARFTVQHACNNTIQHWQLRDLVSYDPNTRIIYTACNSKIVGFNLHTRSSFTVVAASQRTSRAASPGTTTFSVDSGYLATGTDKGELCVHEVQSNGSVKPKPRFQGTITRQNEVLNNLCIVPSKVGCSGAEGPRLYACGNDQWVRCYSLSNMECIDELKQGVAVNCSAEDPTGRMLVTLGDDNVVQVYARGGNGRLQPSAQMKVPTDSNNACGMCCAWHPWANVFATAFQCGQMVVWDVRSCQRVATMKAPRAVRSVKFSTGPMDMLAFAEHEQAFHLVDARNYSARQTLCTSVNNVGISGLTFADSGSRLFVGIDGRGIQEWSMDSTARRGFSVASMA